MNKGSLIYRRYLSVEKPHPFWFYICGFNISILGGLFAVLFLRLLGPGTAGMGIRRRFLAVSLSLLAIGFYTLLVGGRLSGTGGDHGGAGLVRGAAGPLPGWAQDPARMCSRRGGVHAAARRPQWLD